jgi:phage baseplate assembly protein W
MSVRPIYSYNGTEINVPKREIGISLRFQRQGVFTSTYTTAEQTKNQLINFILTNPGERFFDPAFGSGIRSLLFEQSVDLDSLSDTLKEKIELYVQNIRVSNVLISQGDSNDISIAIVYSIQNIQDTLNITLTNETL